MNLKKAIINAFALVILIVALVLITGQKPYRRGFWCSDESIRYARQEETVDVKELMLLCAGLPFIVILLTEIVASVKVQKLILSKFIKSARRASESGSSFWSRLRSVTYSWFFTLSMTAFITGIIKVQVGRLRPIFYHTCVPDVSCDDPVNQAVYITNYTCTGDASLDNFIRSSFPSGHTSYTFSSMIFLIYYISKRFNIDRYSDWRYFVSLVQSAFLSIAIYVGLSRIADNIHHWQDVLGGFLIAVVVTLVCIYFLDDSTNFHELKFEPDESKSKTERPENVEIN